MKNIPYIALILSCFLAFACGGNEDPVIEADAPVLLGTTPENGAGGFIESSLSVVFHFDQNIKCSEQAQKGITVDNDASVDNVSAYGPDLTVALTGLARGKTFTVTIPAGAVQGYRKNQKDSGAYSMSFSTRENDPVPTDPEDPKDWEDAFTAARHMGVGWNLGNTLDSNSGDVTHMWIEGSTDRSTSDYETAWGQPVATRALIHMFKEAGFGAIRVPVTWYPHIGTVTVVNRHDEQGVWHSYWDMSTWKGYDVDPKWMARVKEVVSYVLDEGMYCILNVHHDTGSASTAWLKADRAVHDAVEERYRALWTQIATEFESFGQRLVFESFNEMLDSGNNWNYSTSEAHEVINMYNADFVSTVRATGGRNAYRNLIVNTYAASTDTRALADFRLPGDSVENHLLAEVHSYAPYHFAFQTPTPKKVFDAACEEEVAGIIANLNTYFVSKGIPCVLGEFGADTSERAETELAKQAACYISNASKYNIPCYYWMSLSNAEDRTVPKWSKPVLKDAILKAYMDSRAK